MPDSTTGSIGTRFNIDSKDAEAAIANLTKLMGVMQMTVGDVKKQMSTMFVDQAGAIQQHTAAVGGSTSALREFRSEQRLHNYTIRQSREGVMSLALALIFLSGGSKDASASTERLKNSLMVGVGAAESTAFAMFGLGQAASKMKGPIGEALGTFSAYGPALSLILGLSSAVISFFSSTNEAAKKAADEGLKQYEERLNALPRTALQAESGSVTMTASQARARISQLTQKGMREKTFGGGPMTDADQVTMSVFDPKALSAPERDELEALKKKLPELDAMIDTVGAVTERLNKTESAIAGQLLNQYKERESQLAKTLALATSYEEQAKVAAELSVTRNAISQMTSGNVPLTDINGKKTFQGIITTTAQNQAIDQETARALQEEINAQNLKHREEADEINSRSEKAAAEASKKLQESQLAYLSEIGQSFQLLTQGLDALGMKQDSLLAKAIKTIEMILKALQLAQKSSDAEGNVGIPGVIGGIGSFLGVIGSFLSVASTPPVNPYAHRGTPAMQTTIVLEGTMDGQQFLVKNIPSYNRYQAKKILG